MNVFSILCFQRCDVSIILFFDIRLGKKRVWTLSDIEEQRKFIEDTKAGGWTSGSKFFETLNLNELK